MKTLVTHFSVDLDAIAACWFVKKYLNGWDGAEIKFVPAGTTLDNKSPNTDPDIIHVDTGFGQFDHHQTNEYTSATKLVFEHLCRQKIIANNDVSALERIVNYVNDTDHFAEVNYPDPHDDRYDFCLHQLVFGLRQGLKDDNYIVEFSFNLLDAALQLMKSKVSAEKEIKKGYSFTSKFGKTLVIETSNHESIKLALKQGYTLVATKDPKSGNIRVKTLPDKKYDLSDLHKEIIKADKKGTWFLHISKNMLLNASSKNPDFVPSSVSLQKLVEIIKEI